MSVKTTNPHKANFSSERSGNSETQFLSHALLRLLVHACTKVVKKRAPRDTFFRYHEKYCVPKLILT